ncbi:hypothetical protein VU04_03435 [Desulfobulbus sp. TB]|nr:hypothetical protein [Desulfobulbus sp. TB]
MITSQLPILHTSDWHIGRTLYGRHRYAEFTAFFDWLYNTIIEQTSKSEENKPQTAINICFKFTGYGINIY